MVSTLKLPSAREKPCFSVRGSPKPNVRTESVRVRRRAMTKSSAHRVKLKQKKQQRMRKVIQISIKRKALPPTT